LNTKGIYILNITLENDAVIKIGKKTEHHFRKGFYLYVGSAAGAGGIEGRLKHHKSKPEKPHWHIDYLRLHAQVSEIYVLEGEKELEHSVAEKLKKCFTIPMTKFGSSDCGCEAHLFYSISKITLHYLNKIMSQKFIRHK
jgi:Uri superfamily endonuclease